MKNYVDKIKCAYVFNTHMDVRERHKTIQHVTREILKARAHSSFFKRTSIIYNALRMLEKCIFQTELVFSRTILDSVSSRMKEFKDEYRNCAGYRGRRVRSIVSLLKRVDKTVREHRWFVYKTFLLKTKRADISTYIRGFI